MKVKIADLVRDPALQVREALDEGTVARYADVYRETPDAMPPVGAVKTPEGLLLYGGWHRVAAVEGLGLDEIEADVTVGTRQDAVLLAAKDNTKHGLPLTEAGTDRAVLMVREAQPEWSQRRLSRELGLSQRTVDRSIHADEVLSHIAQGDAARRHPSPTKRHLASIHQAPQEHWLPLAEAAMAQGWTTRQTEEEVRKVNGRQRGDTMNTKPQPLTTAYSSAQTSGDTMNTKPVVEAGESTSVITVTPSQVIDAPTRELLVGVGQEKDWTKNELDLAMHNMADPRLPIQFKDRLLSGSDDPVFVSEDGEFARLQDTVSRNVKKALRQDPILALNKAMEALAHLDLFSVEEIAEQVDMFVRDLVLSPNHGLEHYEILLRSIREKVRRG